MEGGKRLRKVGLKKREKKKGGRGERDRHALKRQADGGRGTGAREGDIDKGEREKRKTNRARRPNNEK